MLLKYKQVWILPWILLSPRVYGQNKSKLPPNWDAGGAATIERRGGFAVPNKTTSPRPSHPSATLSDSPSSPTFSHELGAVGSIPEFIRFDYKYSFDSYLKFQLGLSLPVPVNVDISMPSDLIKADTSKGLAVAYPAFDIALKITWGPHIFMGGNWHPFGGSWFNSVGLGARSLRITGSASSPLRVCSIIEAAKEPPCGNDSAAIQTRNSIHLNADVTMLTYFGRVATGWNFQLADQWSLLLELGVLKPFRSYRKAQITANITAPDGTNEDLTGALGELKAKSETDLEEKALYELDKYINHPLPVLGLGVGYQF